MRMISLKDAFNEWNTDIRPAVIAHYGPRDQVALAESWNDFTDDLCKGRRLSDLQYHYSPAEDEPMPDNDVEFILGALNVEMRCVEIPKRTTPVDLGFYRDASHFACTFSRLGYEFTVEYSQGSALVNVPQFIDVFGSILTDVSGVENNETFDEWCDSYGMDNDSRSAERCYEACKAELSHLKEMFTGDELDGLIELNRELY